MTERRRDTLARNSDQFMVGPSSARWDGAGLSLDIDEIGAPWPQRVRGRIRLIPSGINQRAFLLDPAGRHRWRPIAPVARVEINFARPSIRWSGHGYLDSNEGDEPIPAAFRSWDWSRADLRDGAATLYDTVGHDGVRRSLATRFDRHGESEDFEPPPRARLPSTLWRVARGTQAEPGLPPRVVETLEDTPFYARSVLETRLLGQTVPAVHESLDAGRLDTAIVRMMLPFRMPRRFF